ncbi:MAG: multicopper oxidase family protein [Acidobacteriia bacterium]|nr:multicopper oxidase family protein [Terriglobia bacterium]
MASSYRRTFLKASLGLPFSLSKLSSTPTVVDVALEARQGRMRVAGRTAYLYGYNGQVPGPMIEARPGDHMRVRFRNGLVEPTNIHYHGLHVSPSGNADNVMLRIPAGESFTYEFDLPASHRGGTFWYHPHVHESVARQISRGLAGVFIIRGELDQIPEIASAPEAVLVLQDFSLSSHGDPLEPNMMERMMGREGSLVTANGEISPALLIQRDGWLRLRILNASSSRFHRIQLEEHPLHVIATDGGALAAPEERDEILLLPGERAEVMVRGNRPAGQYRLLSHPYNRGGMMGMGMRMGRGMGSGMMGAGMMGMGMMGRSPGLSPGPLVLATLSYRGRAAKTWNLPRQLVRIDPLPKPTVYRTFQLGGGMGMGMMMGGMMSFTINGRTFDPDRIDTRAELNTVEEWEFVNSSMMDHPMHIHTNPFQVMDPDGGAARSWKDMVLVRAGDRVRVRTAFRDFTGAAMYHCHILDHEDLGMMGRLEITSRLRGPKPYDPTH